MYLLREESAATQGKSQQQPKETVLKTSYYKWHKQTEKITGHIEEQESATELSFICHKEQVKNNCADHVYKLEGSNKKLRNPD